VAKSNKSSSDGRKSSGKPVKKIVSPVRPERETPSLGTDKPWLRKSPLSKKELMDFRNLLIQKRRTLVGDLSGMEQETTGNQSSGNLSSMPTHMADVGTDNFQQEFTLGLLESEQAMLREINEALARVDENTYGICLGTGQAIPLTRLRAKPWAKYTVEYARMLEKGLVRPPDADHDEEGREDEEEPDEEEDDGDETEAGGEGETVGEVEAHDDDEE
jgi:RNA polymerase-binding transcription factor DksA